MKKLMLVFILIILFIGGCKKEGIPDNNIENTNAEKTLKGITLTPRSFAPNDFTNFFVKAKQTGHIITWSGDWIELSNTNKGGPTVLAELSKQYNFIPLVITQFFTQSTGKLLRPLDEATKQTYKNSAVAFAEKYKPKYMGLGIEVNMLYENFPNDFENFVSFYNEVYNAIKAVSPETKIFTVFQLEKMKGLGGGLFGGTNDINKAQWFLIDKFQSDTIVFTEIGWHTSNSPIGWESSEHEQAEFIKTFFELTKDISKEFIIYSFMFDQNTIEPFNSAGLYDSSGNPRLALNEWQKH